MKGLVFLKKLWRNVSETTQISNTIDLFHNGRQI